MCGLAGFLKFGNLDGVDFALQVSQMADRIASRGPDDSGLWIDYQSNIALAHRRLSIVDLSPSGRQPMHSLDARYVIVFNGEIYNHLKLRETIELSRSVPAWRGHSDTETLLAAFETWGIEGALARCQGMFAFAVWDAHKKRLWLGRDRCGEKPIYYGWQGNTFLFGSELKALRGHPDFNASIDRRSVATLMRHSTIPSPYSIYQGIFKLPPGTLLSISSTQRDDAPQAYWSLNQAVTAGLASPFGGSPEEAVEKLNGLLLDAVGQQMLAEVPLGAFLSGGIDSSLVVALMQTQVDRPVKTFSIGFQESGYDEAPYAKEVARHLGTTHTELYVSAQQAMDVIPRLPHVYCEPFSDSSQIPTFLVSQLARQHVTVALSGDAGDELFGGYSRYVLGRSIWHKISRVPLFARNYIGRMLLAVPAQQWETVIRCGLPLLSRFGMGNLSGDRLHKGAAIMSARSTAELYQYLVSHWDVSDDLVLDAGEHSTVLNDLSRQPEADNFVHQMMAMDMVTYLPDDILTKVDRAAMAVSLETRVPFLDHRIVEFAWSLPLDYKIRNGVGKWPLREVLYKYVPRHLIDRPKMGFGVPIDSWLRGPLRAWAEELLDEARLKKEGFFNPAPIRRKWAEHLSGQRNWQYHLWDVLMFQAWLEAQ